MDSLTMDSLESARWRKSSYSGGNGGACVEVASDLPGIIAVRDSKDPGGPHLVFTRNDWLAFVARVQDGQFNVS